MACWSRPRIECQPHRAAITRFTAAANDGRYDPTTRKRADKSATFLRCPIGCQAAGNVVESLAQGARLLVTGVLRQRAGKATDGDQRYADEVDATEVGASLTWVTVKVNHPGFEPRPATRCLHPPHRGHRPTPHPTQLERLAGLLRDNHHPSPSS